MAPTVSVALASRNGAKYIGAQIASILAQSVIPDELVLSDDASSDGTVEIVERLVADGAARGERMPRLRALRNDPPLGVTSNFENAVRACSGEVIVLCDQDDVWHPDRLAAALAAFDADPAALLTHSDARLVDEAGAPLGRTLFASLEVDEGTLDAIVAGGAFDVYLRRNLATGATVAFRRELLDVALPFPREWVHDEWLAILAAATGAVAVSTEPLVDYRQHGANEIGVAAPTLRRKIGRVLQADGGRIAGLARRAEVLAERLEATGAGAAVIRSAREKARFEAARAALPASRPARLPGVLALDRAGGYARFASQGRRDILRDLLQRRDPAESAETGGRGRRHGTER